MQLQESVDYFKLSGREFRQKRKTSSSKNSNVEAKAKSDDDLDDKFVDFE